MITAKKWKQAQGRRREDAAIRAMYWIMTGIGFLIVIPLVLAGCGQDQSKTYVQPSQDHLKGNTVLWQGPASADPFYAKATTEVAQCVAAHWSGPLHPGWPEIVVTAGPVYCGPSSYRFGGCTDGNTIYVQTEGPFNHSGQGDADVIILIHELVHWVSGIGDEGHNGPVFMACSPNMPD